MNKKKRNIHLPLYLVTYHCFHCKSNYQVSSTSNQDVSHESCKNCNPFYTGVSASEIKEGNVEKYYRRLKKSEDLSNKK